MTELTRTACPLCQEGFDRCDCTVQALTKYTFERVSEGVREVEVERNRYKKALEHIANSGCENYSGFREMCSARSNRRGIKIECVPCYAQAVLDGER